MERRHGMGSVEEHLKELAEQLFSAQGFELVDASVIGHRGRTFVQVTADREGGITVDDCARLSRALSAVLDREDLFNGFYRLEVSSPGLDRPLKTARDFRKALGRDVKVDAVSGGRTNQVTGCLKQVDQDQIWIETESGTLTLPLPSVVHAKIKLKW
jgi:ribosome maturation factor RimP